MAGHHHLPSYNEKNVQRLGYQAEMEMNRIFQTVGRVEGDTIPAPRKDVAVHCQGQVVGETSCHLAHLQRHIFAITH